MAFVDLVDAIFFYPVGMELAQVLTRAFTQFARTRVAMLAEIHSALRVVEKDVTRNIHRTGCGTAKPADLVFELVGELGAEIAILSIKLFQLCAWELTDRGQRIINAPRNSAGQSPIRSGRTPSPALVAAAGADHHPWSAESANCAP